MAFKPKIFMALCLLAIVVTRSAIIFGSNEAGMDIKIYREVGQLLSNGINPYDFTSNESLRQALRTDDYGLPPEENRGRAGYDYYVSGNLPASTALYGIIDWIGHSKQWWRLALALGDVLAAAGAFFLFSRACIPIDTISKQTAFALAMVYYPSAIQWGVIYSEDKQFQTALMFFLAGLVIRGTWKAPTAAAIAIGAVGSIGVLFKALGVFLVPLALNYFRARPRRDFIIAVASAALIAVLFCLYFGTAFIFLIGARTTGGSSAFAYHGSPWVLLPHVAAQYARPLLCVLLLIGACAAYHRQKIDMLNLCAAACVIFTCLWITSGSMDRMNIAMIFAMMCMATVSVGNWCTLVTVNFAFQVPLYAGVIARLHDPRWLFYPERPDAIATIVFLISYFTILYLAPVREAGDPLRFRNAEDSK
jgi:hypothetical protein